MSQIAALAAANILPQAALPLIQGSAAPQTQGNTAPHLFDPGYGVDFFRSSRASGRQEIISHYEFLQATPDVLATDGKEQRGEYQPVLRKKSSP